MSHHERLYNPGHAEETSELNVMLMMSLAFFLPFKRAVRRLSINIVVLCD